MLLHTERAPHNPVIRLFLFTLTAVLLLVLSWSLVHERRGSVALGVAFLILLWATSSYLTMRFEVTDEAVRAVMWPFSTTVRYADLKYAGVTEQDLPRSLGYGLRLRGRKAFYRTRDGRGVVLEKFKKSTRYLTHLVLTTQHPEAFARLVDERRKAWRRLQRSARHT
ncbi:hypothetical protein D6789_02870 [Candidatus Woesearchaeota archaeon]|nr:MAG: hypothetical protein D6789_02870 [Candidatus Woesearchaeota archaeon]